MNDDRRPEPIPLSRALLFGPLGLLMKANDDLPELFDAVHQARRKAASQMRTANTIGRFVTPILRRRVKKLVEEQLAARPPREVKVHGPTVHGPTVHGPTVHGPTVHGPKARTRPPRSALRTAPGAIADERVAPSPRATPGTTTPGRAAPTRGAAPKGKAVAKAASGPSTRVPRARAGAAPVPTAPDLGIPGYDGLPSSSIVPLLEGLTRRQLAAVEAHEQSNRARRTVLHRTQQLLAT